MLTVIDATERWPIGRADTTTYEVTPRAVELLIAQGWTPPTTDNPPNWI